MNAKVMEIANEMLAEAGGDIGQEFQAATNTQLRGWAERLMEEAKRRDEMRPGMSEERQKDDAWLRHAIEQARQAAEKHGDTTCGQEHRRLVGWLEELRDLRAVGYLSRTLDALKKILELAKDGEASAPMSHAGDNCCHIVYACEDALSHLPKEPNENAGNMAKMREALLLVREWYLHDNADTGLEMLDNAIAALDAALAAPARNCDVGTAEEQAHRFFAFCHAHRAFDTACSNCCPFKDAPDINHCQSGWGQLPYEAPAKKGGAK